MMQHEAAVTTSPAEVAPGTGFRYGRFVFAVEAVPPDGNSLFQAVLNSGLLPAGMTVQKLRLGLLRFASEQGRTLAIKLMRCFSENHYTDFNDYLGKKLGTSGVESDNFEVVLLAVLTKINLVVFKQSSSGIAVFNARNFLTHQARALPMEIPTVAEIYLFQRQIRFGINNAVCNHFLSLRLVSGLSPKNGAAPAPLTSPGRKSAPQLPPPPQPVPEIPVPAKAVGMKTPGLQRDDSSGLAPLPKILDVKLPIPKTADTDTGIFDVEIGSDFRLLLDRQVFFIHRNIVAENCGAFREFFSSEFFTKFLQNPRWNGRDIIIRLPDSAPVSEAGFGAIDRDKSMVFRQFLELIYDLTTIESISTPNLAYIVVIADRMESERILQKCGLELAPRLLKFCPKLLEFARTFRLGFVWKMQLEMLDDQIVDNFELIETLSEQDLSDYFSAATKLPPVKLMTVALIYLCGLDDKNQIRKRGDFYEISRRLTTCQKWVELCARKCRNSRDLTELYALICRTRLIQYDGSHDDVLLRDIVMRTLTATNSSSSR